MPWGVIDYSDIDDAWDNFSDEKVANELKPGSQRSYIILVLLSGGSFGELAQAELSWLGTCSNAPEILFAINLKGPTVILLQNSLGNVTIVSPSFVKSKRNSSELADSYLVTVRSPILDIPPLVRFVVTPAEVASEIRKLNANKALACPVIVPLITDFYNHTFTTGCLPKSWKRANVVPVFKRGVKNNLLNIIVLFL